MKEIRCSYRGIDERFYTGGEIMNGPYKYVEGEIYKTPIYIVFFSKGRQEGEEVTLIYLTLYI